MTPQIEDNSGNFYESFSDLIFCTLVLFLMIVLFLVLNVNKRVDAVREGESRVTEMLGSLRFTALRGASECGIAFDFRHQPPRICFIPRFFVEEWDDLEARDYDASTKKKIKQRLANELVVSLDSASRFSLEEAGSLLGAMSPFLQSGRDVSGCGASISKKFPMTVTRVAAGSSAEAGGLLAGDQIVGVNGGLSFAEPTEENLEEFLEYFTELFTKPSDITKPSANSQGIKISVVRKGELISLNLPKENTVSFGENVFFTNKVVIAVASGALGDDNLPDTRSSIIGIIRRSTFCSKSFLTGVWKRHHACREL